VGVPTKDASLAAWQGELAASLKLAGAALVGFADLSCLPTEACEDLPKAISIAVALEPAVVSGLSSGPSAAYHAEYDRANATVANRAGLGWIGHSAILVTPAFGKAVRLASVLTDAPFICAEPVLESRCGRCRRSLGILGALELIAIESSMRMPVQRKHRPWLPIRASKDVLDDVTVASLIHREGLGRRAERAARGRWV